MKTPLKSILVEGHFDKDGFCEFVVCKRNQTFSEFLLYGFYENCFQDNVELYIKESYSWVVLP